MTGDSDSTNGMPEESGETSTDADSVFCVGCGKDMWEYSEEAKEDSWCISCAPECYIGGVHVTAKEARL